MCLLITGASGFIGQAVSNRLAEMDNCGPVRLIDRELPSSQAGFETRQVDLQDAQQLASALKGVTRIIHLASLAGLASEADPEASRAVNLDASLNLIEALGNSAPGARLVYASSIAVFGQPGTDAVDDTTLPTPRLTYGTHKLMVEHAIADVTRRGLIDGVALRLPGVVARPKGSTSLKSAFISEVFWAIAEGRLYEVPVPPTATMWLLSIEACVSTILLALFLPLPSALRGAITVPALRVTMSELIAAIGAATSRTPNIAYRPDPGITAKFGAYPSLYTAAADKLGFCHDGDLPRLVARSVGRSHP